jgi:DnaJ homolog subfamily A member 5
VHNPLEFTGKDRKLADKANQKARLKAKKAYEIAVIELAEYVRKRDPRIKKYEDEKKLERQEREDKLMEAKRIERERRVEVAKEFEEPEWSKLDNVQECIICDMTAHNTYMPLMP